MNALSVEALRRYAISRSLFTATTLPRAIARLGFVQADPIRAPARAQDLTLRHRVQGYHAGDLERRYARLPIEEDYFVNYGFLPRATHHLMHPRVPRTVWPQERWAQAQAVLEFVRERGVVHPRDVDAQFQHGKVKNWFGGSSNASTQLLDGMHYRGLVRIAGRDAGTRLYAARESLPAAGDAHAAMDQLIDVVVNKYAPLPERSLGELVSHLRGGAPQWAELRRDALARSKARLPSATLAGTRWYWPAGENPGAKMHQTPDALRLLAPFDPVVWDRRRFELFWGWAYRFEAYTPAPRRVRGYHALPLLWRDAVIGWGNLAMKGDTLSAELGYISGRAPRERAYTAALESELEHMRVFLSPR